MCKIKVLKSKIMPILFSFTLLMKPSWNMIGYHSSLISLIFILSPPIIYPNYLYILWVFSSLLQGLKPILSLLYSLYCILLKVQEHLYSLNVCHIFTFLNYQSIYFLLPFLIVLTLIPLFHSIFNVYNWFRFT